MSSMIFCSYYWLVSIDFAQVGVAAAFLMIGVLFCSSRLVSIDFAEVGVAAAFLMTDMIFCSC